MSVSALLPLASLLTLSSDEKQTVENLKAFATSFGASKVAESTGAMNIVQALRGEAPAPKWLVKIASVVKSVKDQPEHQDLLLRFVDTFLVAKGIEKETATNLVRKVAPIIGLNTEGLSDDEVILSALATIADNVKEDEYNPSYTGIVKCPECKFVHFV